MSGVPIWIDAEQMSNGIYVVRDPRTERAIGSLRKVPPSAEDFAFWPSGDRGWDPEELRTISDVLAQLNREGSLVSIALGGPRG